MLNFYAYDDPRIKTFGRWEEEDGSLASYGTISFLKCVFEGSEIALEGETGGPIFLTLDHDEKAVDFSGRVSFRLAPGVHRLSLEVRGAQVCRIRGLYAPSLLEETARPRPYIKFIGDSITNAYPGFTVPAVRLLDAEFSNDSFGGMSLSDGMGWPKEKSPKVGMESYYFRCCHDQFDTDYAPYTFRFDGVPDILVVFLGTNDYLDCPEDKEAGNVPHFASHYAAFIEKLAALYPTARLCIFEPLSDKYCRKEGIEAAFALMKASLGDRVELVPTDTWSVALSPDGTHPSSDGYTALGVRLAGYLAERL